MRKSHDRHLNLFWCYNGKPYLEDNLTRAFITTLSSLNKVQQVNFINWFSGECISTSDDTEITFDLQNPYLDITNEIKNAKRRVLVGFNPTGKSWGNEEYSILDNIESYKFDKNKLELNEYEDYLKNKLSLDIKKLKEIDEFEKTYGEKLRDIILSYLNRGESRPDGWIFIHKNKVLEVVIAIETKLWDLDPEQLANHCEKCLNISKEEVKYKAFKETFDELKKMKNKDDNIILEHFLEYMEKTGHYINNDYITREDFDNIVILNRSNHNSDLQKKVLERKFINYFKNYFKSKEYLDMEIKYNLDKVDLKRRRIFIKEIGQNGLGNIYFDTDFNTEIKTAFFIGTEIGVSSKCHNERFSRKIEDENFLSVLNKLYPKVENSLKQKYERTFDILVRVNQCAYSDYIHLNSGDELCRILDLKRELPFKTQLTKFQCVKILEKYLKEGNKYLEKKVLTLKSRGGDNSIASNYNTLSYLRFIDYIKQEYILDIDQKEFNVRFSDILEKHLKGLMTIDKMMKYCKIIDKNF